MKDIQFFGTKDIVSESEWLLKGSFKNIDFKHVNLIMKIDGIDSSNFVIILVDHDTGIILNKDGSYYIQEGENYYYILANEKKARQKAEMIIQENKNMEVIIYDGSGNWIDIYKPL